jgi:hypothetical protein
MMIFLLAERAHENPRTLDPADHDRRSGADEVAFGQHVDTFTIHDRHTRGAQVGRGHARLPHEFSAVRCRDVVGPLDSHERQALQQRVLGEDPGRRKEGQRRQDDRDGDRLSRDEEERESER